LHANRYAVNANMVFKWLRDPRYAPESIAPADAHHFLPVEIVGHGRSDDVVVAVDPVSPRPSKAASSCEPKSAPECPLSIADTIRHSRPAAGRSDRTLTLKLNKAGV
jgi:hypothetical protein